MTNRLCQNQVQEIVSIQLGRRHIEGLNSQPNLTVFGRDNALIKCQLFFLSLNALLQVTEITLYPCVGLTVDLLRGLKYSDLPPKFLRLGDLLRDLQLKGFMLATLIEEGEASLIPAELEGQITNTSEQN